MMKVFAFMVIAVSLVVGMMISLEDFSSDFTDALLRIANMTQWDRQCREELGFNPETAPHNNETARIGGCFFACLLEKSESIKDGKLGEREKVCEELAAEWSIGLALRPKEGRTFRQLAEKCYDEAKNQTDKCEIGLAVGKCLAENADNVEDQSSEEEESAILR